MPRSSLHAFLRESTSESHRALERKVGDLSDMPAYKRYLRGLYAFRQPVEERLRGIVWPAAVGHWRPVLIADELAADIDDLGEKALPPAQKDDPDTDLAKLMGTLYVLEGSSLGARMIFRHVRQLGLNERHGARHLAKQDAAATNWREFLLLLERYECTAPAVLAAAANAAFSSAERAMSEGEFGPNDVDRERQSYQL